MTTNTCERFGIATNERPKAMTGKVNATIIFYLCVAFSSINLCAQGIENPSITDIKTLKDFMGRPIPSIARGFINMKQLPVVPGLLAAGIPEWIEKDGLELPGYEFINNPKKNLLDANIWIDDVYRNGVRVSLIRKIYPDRSWAVLDIYSRHKDEVTIAICDPVDHEIPEDHILIGIMRRGDPRTPPSPPRPTVHEILKYQKEYGSFPERMCVGDNQRAHMAGLLNLKTGKLSLYTKKKVACLSPFYNPCPSD